MRYLTETQALEYWYNRGKEDGLDDTKAIEFSELQVGLIKHKIESEIENTKMKKAQTILINFVQEFNLGKIGIDGDGDDVLRVMTMEDINGFIKRNNLS